MDTATLEAARNTNHALKIDNFDLVLAKQQSRGRKLEQQLLCPATTPTMAFSLCAEGKLAKKNPFDDSFWPVCACVDQGNRNCGYVSDAIAELFGMLKSKNK